MKNLAAMCELVLFVGEREGASAAAPLDALALKPLVP
jgi:hypothetical protein